MCHRQSLQSLQCKGLSGDSQIWHTSCSASGSGWEMPKVQGGARHASSSKRIHAHRVDDRRGDHWHSGRHRDSATRNTPSVRKSWKVSIWRAPLKPPSLSTTRRTARGLLSWWAHRRVLATPKGRVASTRCSWTSLPRTSICPPVAAAPDHRP